MRISQRLCVPCCECSPGEVLWAPIKPLLLLLQQSVQGEQPKPPICCPLAAVHQHCTGSLPHPYFLLKSVSAMVPVAQLYR